MEYIRHTLDYKIKENTVITLGKFDGLHLGHELLINKVIELSAINDLKSVVFTFDVPPNSNNTSKVITTNVEKEYIFEKTGIDVLFECPFTKEVMCMEAEEFIAWISNNFNVKYIVVGTDFGFGHNRSGNYQTLIDFSSKYNYQVIVMDKKQYNGRDISSTFIREELEKGNVKLANELLGYEFFISGEVIHGKQIGRTIGIPTINMAIAEEKIIPPFGVYVSKVLVDGEWHIGVSNMGRKPTISGDNPVGIETYIINFNKDIYGKNVTVLITEFLRPEMKFDSIEMLKNQMNSDIKHAIEYYENITK